jgi:hypothetical protein
MPTKQARQPRRPNNVGQLQGRSVRVSDEAWEKARRRAQYEGVTMSRMVALIVEGYGAGLIDLPKTTVTYTPTKNVS